MIKTTFFTVLSFFLLVQGGEQQDEFTGFLDPDKKTEGSLFDSFSTSSISHKSVTKQASVTPVKIPEKTTASQTTEPPKNETGGFINDDINSIQLKSEPSIKFTGFLDSGKKTEGNSPKNETGGFLNDDINSIQLKGETTEPTSIEESYVAKVGEFEVLG